MAETLVAPQVNESQLDSLLRKPITRREAMVLAVGSAVALFAEIKEVFELSNELKEGIRLNPPGLEVDNLDYETKINNGFMGWARVDNKNFFTEDKPIVHRAGNTKKDIDFAFKKRAKVFDIDANDVGTFDKDGHEVRTIYGEHGLIYQRKIFNRKINIVFDPAEAEIRTRLPATFEELIKHIHSLSTQENPLGVFVDIKRGPFKEEALENLINILLKYNVPALIDPKARREVLLRIRKIQNEKHINISTGAMGRS